MVVGFSDKLQSVASVPLHKSGSLGQHPLRMDLSCGCNRGHDEVQGAAEKRTERRHGRCGDARPDPYQTDNRKPSINKQKEK